MNSGTIGEISGDFINNSVQTSASSSSGGAVYNGGTIKNIMNSSFYRQYSVSGGESRRAGCLFKQVHDMTDGSRRRWWFFSGNYTQDKRGKIYNALYATDTSTITFNTAATARGQWQYGRR